MPEVEFADRVVPPSRAVQGTAIAGLGVAVPERVVPNEEIAERLGVKPRWITARTGIERRHVADPEYTLVDLATDAGNAALADAGIDADEIDTVIVCTCTAEMRCPAAAPVVAANLGTNNAAAIDLNIACSGFLAGLGMASGWIGNGSGQKALVVGADLMYRFLDHDDRSTAGIFADGGGAVVLTPCEGEGRLGRVHLGTDGARGDLVEASAKEGIIRMNGHDTFRQAVRRICESTLEALEEAELGIDDIDLFVYHQANSRITGAVGEELGLDPAKVVDCIDEYGNTSAGTIPIALAVAREDGRLTQGSQVLLGAFGGGLSWGAGVVRWGLAEGA